MSVSLVFDEPMESSSQAIDSYCRYFRHSISDEAVRARKIINSWYSNFPDTSRQVRGNLRANQDKGILSAIDELLVHHLLQQEPDVRYEEEHRSPDFRIYRDSTLCAAIEVLSFFDDADLEAKNTNSERLTDNINARVTSRDWWASTLIKSWQGQPSYKDIARKLTQFVETLTLDDDGGAPVARPEFVYGNYGDPVIIQFKFIPRSRNPQRAPSGIVGFGSPAWGFLPTVDRLRRSIGAKGGDKYDHKDRPFAVFVSDRATCGCDSEDIINAMYGDLSFLVTENPRSMTSKRRQNGLFGRPADSPQGRHSRISCVFVAPGWTPIASQDAMPRRFDNPFAKHPFPDDVIEVADRFLAQPHDSGIRMVWRSSPDFQ